MFEALVRTSARMTLPGRYNRPKLRKSRFPMTDNMGEALVRAAGVDPVPHVRSSALSLPTRDSMRPRTSPELRSIDGATRA
jgi:hypothetical protein